MTVSQIADILNRLPGEWELRIMSDVEGSAPVLQPMEVTIELWSETPVVVIRA